MDMRQDVDANGRHVEDGGEAAPTRPSRPERGKTARKTNVANSANGSSRDTNIGQSQQKR